jgi:hypothetical protein
VKATPTSVILSLISHTNVGKTTLARTLLRRDVGEVLDQAHVTDETERFVLLETEAGDRVLLADNPGFGDSVRLARRLRDMPDPLAWLVSQVWDRFADRPLFCSQQAVRHVREEADVVLYLVNASEDPEAAGYVAPELEVLSWIGRPVILLLNQTGAPAAVAAREADLARWRALAAAHPVVHDVVALDACTRCWVQEGLLFARIRDVLPPDRRDLLDALLATWLTEQLRALDASLEAMAALLAGAAADAEPVGTESRREARRAADALARRLEAAVSDTNERLIEVHGLHGRAAEELRVELQDVTGPAAGEPAWRRTLWGGLVGGALGGLAADLATGGLTLGGGTLMGAILGAAGAHGLAWGMEMLRGEEARRVAWSATFLDRFAIDTVLRYLAVAHFGRGAGAFRTREHPTLLREAAERALVRERPALRAALRRAREAGADATRTALVAPLAAAVRAALSELYPEGAPWLASQASGATATGSAAAAGTTTGTTPGSTSKETGVVPQ